MKNCSLVIMGVILSSCLSYRTNITGYSPEYLTSKWKQTKRPGKSVYLQYWYYDNGIRIGGGEERLHYYNVESDNAYIKRDSVILLHGIYKFYDRKHRLVIEIKYADGKRLYYKHFLPQTGNLYEYVDYTKKYNQQEGSYFVEMYYENIRDSVKIRGYMAKTGKGWRYLQVQ